MKYKDYTTLFFFNKLDLIISKELLLNNDIGIHKSIDNLIKNNEKCNEKLQYYIQTTNVYDTHHATIYDMFPYIKIGDVYTISNNPYVVLVDCSKDTNKIKQRLRKEKLNIFLDRFR